MRAALTKALGLRMRDTATAATKNQEQESKDDDSKTLTDSHSSKLLSRGGQRTMNNRTLLGLFSQTAQAKIGLVTAHIRTSKSTLRFSCSRHDAPRA